jgi:signal transduction histidine kinase
VEQSVLEMSRALAVVVDSELERRDDTLTLLSLAPSLANGELDRFSNLMRRAAEASGSRIFLLDPEWRPVLGTGPLESFSMPFESLGPPRDSGTTVSSLYLSPEGDKRFALARPVIVNSEIRHRLVMVSPIEDFQELLVNLSLPKRWIGVMVDHSGTIVARSRNPDLHVGNHVNPDVRQHLRRGNEGYFQSVTRDGMPTVAAFHKVPESGWSFIVGIPEADINQSAADALRMLVVTAVILTAAAVLLSVRVGRTIVEPMRVLTAQADSLGRGESIASINTGLRETDLVSASMAAASEEIKEAKRTLERRVAAAVAEAERSQAALLQSQKLEALGRLTGGIAHDFNNLLQTLSTGLHVADMLPSDADRKSALDSCKRAVGRAAKLTRQLMAFGKNRASEARRMDVCDQLLAMEDLLRGALRGNIELRFDLADDLWPVHLDPLQFELAVLNLAINARDAVEGTGTVRISASNIEVAQGQIPDLQPGQYVRLSFADSGEGMSPAVLQKALDPFFTTKPPGKGSGLGLAQVYGFLKQSKGGVSIESELQRGTTVTLYLPRSGEEAPEGTADRPDASLTPGPEASVLMVEDDVLVRDLVGPALSAQGFEVFTASDADEALRLLDEHEVDLVFSDIVMPGSMNGVQLAQIIRDSRPQIALVLATGYSEDTSALDGIPTITKPYEIPAVVRVLRDVLDQRKSSRC